MKDLEITKGEWKIDSETTIYSLHQTGWDNGKPLMTNRFYLQIYPDFNSSVAQSEVVENAKLIADAGNTTQKCGLLPSELLEQRDELLKCITEILPWCDNNCVDKRKIESLIKKGGNMYP